MWVCSFIFGISYVKGKTEWGYKRVGAGKIFGAKNEEVTGGNCIMRSFLIFTAHQRLFK